MPSRVDLKPFSGVARLADVAVSNALAGRTRSRLSMLMAGLSATSTDVFAVQENGISMGA